MELTNQPGIFLAGVVCGRFDTHKLFIENSREYADKTITAIIKEKRVGVLKELALQML